MSAKSLKDCIEQSPFLIVVFLGAVIGSLMIIAALCSMYVDYQKQRQDQPSAQPPEKVQVWSGNMPF